MKCKNKIEIYDNYAKVYFKDRTYFICDKEDLKYVELRTWHKKKCGTGYAAARIDYKTAFFHRLVMNASGGKDIDHINHNTLDNRKTNLREVTHAENTWNRERKSKYGTGIKKCAYGGYVVTLGYDGYVGTFKTLDEAKTARKKAEIDFLKNKAKAFS